MNNDKSESSKSSNSEAGSQASIHLPKDLDEPNLDSREVYKRLLTYTWEYWWVLLIAIFGFAIYGGTQALAVKLLELIIDSINEPRGDIHNLLPLGVIVIFLFRGLGGFLGSYGMAYIARKVVHHLRVEMFSKLIRMPNAFHALSSPGFLVSKITFNVEQVAAASSNALTVLVREGIVVICLLAYLLYENWKLTLVFLIVLPPIALLVSYVSKRFRRLGKSIQDSMGDVTQVSSEVMNAYQEVKIYGATQFEDERFLKTSANNRKQSMKLAMTTAVNTPVVQFLVAIALCFIMWLALNPTYMGDVSPGQFVAFIMAASLIDKPVRQLTKINQTLQVGIAAAHSIFNLIDLNTEVDEGDGELRQCRGEIEFKNVSFVYPSTEKKVLSNVSFTIRPGQTIALVGRSGSGKSSLVSLIPRFFDFLEGDICIDGVSIKELKLDNLRKHIAIVSQKVTLFNTTIFNNIAYGDLDHANRDNVERAAQMAYADEFIQKLVDKYETEVGQDGVQLSGGQRQRIAIARAILKDAPIMIFDEATSALDTESERYIQSALESLTKDRTTIIVAHRLSTIEKADVILVMDEGKIVESGDHKTLLAKQGFYAKLQQKLEYADEELSGKDIS